MASPRTVIMRKGKLVLDISVADFGDSGAERAALARTLAAKPPRGSSSRGEAPCHDALPPMC